MSRKLRFGMIGGGPGSFIGAVHRTAAQMDRQAELVAGAFSSEAERSFACGRELGLDERRVYGDFVEMAQAESVRSGDDRLDFVVVATPNHQHFAPARAFLEAGFHVVCDKPVTFDLSEALELRRIVERTNRLFVLTHNYSGNSMVRQARELARGGCLGVLRKVVVEYSQGWLTSPVEAAGHKQAAWRTDPARSGAGGCLADIGTHAHHLACYVTGLQVEELCADSARFVPGRRLEDDANVLLRFAGGARGVLHCSQIAAGEDNHLSLRVYGERASLEWAQERCEELVVKRASGPREVWRRGDPELAPAAQSATRLPAGHPEGYLEAFANIYREAFRAMLSHAGKACEAADYPTLDDGIAGMRFIEAAVASAREGSRWIRL
jgi:predicted dehydrogenase